MKLKQEQEQEQKYQNWTNNPKLLERVKDSRTTKQGPVYRPEAPWYLRAWIKTFNSIPMKGRYYIGKDDLVVTDNTEGLINDKRGNFFKVGQNYLWLPKWFLELPLQLLNEGLDSLFRYGYGFGREAQRVVSEKEEKTYLDKIEVKFYSGEELKSFTFDFSSWDYDAIRQQLRNFIANLELQEEDKEYLEKELGNNQLNEFKTFLGSEEGKRKKIVSEEEEEEEASDDSEEPNILRKIALIERIVYILADPGEDEETSQAIITIDKRTEKTLPSRRYRRDYEGYDLITQVALGLRHGVNFGIWVVESLTRPTAVFSKDHIVEFRKEWKLAKAKEERTKTAEALAADEEADQDIDKKRVGEWYRLAKAVAIVKLALNLFAQFAFWSAAAVLIPLILMGVIATPWATIPTVIALVVGALYGPRVVNHLLYHLVRDIRNLFTRHGGLETPEGIELNKLALNATNVDLRLDLDRPLDDPTSLVNGKSLSNTSAYAAQQLHQPLEDPVYSPQLISNLWKNSGWFKWQYIKFKFRVEVFGLEANTAPEYFKDPVEFKQDREVERVTRIGSSSSRGNRGNKRGVFGFSAGGKSSTSSYGKLEVEEEMQPISGKRKNPPKRKTGSDSTRKLLKNDEERSNSSEEEGKGSGPKGSSNRKTADLLKQHEEELEKKEQEILKLRAEMEKAKSKPEKKNENEERDDSEGKEESEEEKGNLSGEEKDLEKKTPSKEEGEKEEGIEEEGEKEEKGSGRGRGHPRPSTPISKGIGRGRGKGKEGNISKLLSGIGITGGGKSVGRGAPAEDTEEKDQNLSTEKGAGTDFSH